MIINQRVNIQSLQNHYSVILQQNKNMLICVEKIRHSISTNKLDPEEHDGCQKCIMLLDAAWISCSAFWLHAFRSCSIFSTEWSPPAIRWIIVYRVGFSLTHLFEELVAAFFSAQWTSRICLAKFLRAPRIDRVPWV